MVPKMVKILNCNNFVIFWDNFTYDGSFWSWWADLTSAIAQDPGVIPHTLAEVNFLTVEIPTRKPYIFMIRATRKIKRFVVQDPGVIPHTLAEVNFLTVEIPTHKPYIFMIRATRKIKRLVAEDILRRFYHISLPFHCEKTQTGDFLLKSLCAYC